MKKLFHKIRFLQQKISRLQIQVYSGNATFFLLLSVIPTAMLFLITVQYLPASVDDIVVFLSSITPAPIHSLIQQVFFDLEPGRAAAVLSATAVGTVWAITRSMTSLMHGLDIVYETQIRRTLLKKWAIAFSCAVLFFLSLLATVLLEVLGRSIHTFSAPLPFRGLFIIGFLTFVFALLYSVLPAKPKSFLSNLPGAALTAAGWLIYSGLFGLYVEHFSKYSLIYGSLSTVVVAMLWLYFCIRLLFYGGLFNQFLASSKHPFRRLADFFRS